MRKFFVVSWAVMATALVVNMVGSEFFGWELFLEMPPVGYQALLALVCMAFTRIELLDKSERL